MITSLDMLAEPRTRLTQTVKSCLLLEKFGLTEAQTKLLFIKVQPG